MEYRSFIRSAPLAGLTALAATLIATAGAGVSPDNVKLSLVPTGAMPKLGGYMPQQLKLSADKPAGLKKLPADVTAPLYGTLMLGAKEHPTPVLIVVDEPDGKDSRLFVDSNLNGDLTDDPPTEWKKRTTTGRNKETFNMFLGGATVNIKYDGTTVPLHFGMYRFDKTDPSRAAIKDTLLYYRDYGYEGEMILGGKTYKFMISDDMATGDFRGKDSEKNSGVHLLIDRNENGKFGDVKGESYDVREPFNIGGTTYELTGLTAGGKFKLAKSKTAVAEVQLPPPPPDLSPGRKALVFNVKTMDGKAVSFPESYKGKLVMIDFWATWCGPCIGELPNLTKAYQKYHDRGFEVLGVTLDQANADAKVTAFTKEKNMAWPQIYDGKFWNAEIAQLYHVQSIPCAYLVDGDTGQIVAASDNGKFNDLRGESLEKTLEAQFAKKGK